MAQIGSPSTKDFSSEKKEAYLEQQELVKSIKFLMEQRENEYYETLHEYRETQIRYDKEVIKLNWLREEIESSRSV